MAILDGKKSGEHVCKRIWAIKQIISVEIARHALP
jgi:hypothetical protein